jgi:hypothetical protein
MSMPGWSARPGHTEPGDGGVDQARVQLAERVVVDAQALDGARAERHDDDDRRALKRAGSERLLRFLNYLWNARAP